MTPSDPPLRDYQGSSPISALAVKILIALMTLGTNDVLAILVLAWRRRKFSPLAVFSTIAYAWLIFFVFSPGTAAQYLVWLAPFVLLLSPGFYVALVSGGSVFLFALYTLSSGGFPWHFAHATTKLNLISAHWAAIPWLILLGGLFAMALKARQQHLQLRFLSLAAIEAKNAPE
jgi:hypothetical protein